MTEAHTDAPAWNWTEEALTADEVSKRELLQFIQDQAAPRFLAEKKLKGTLKNVLKTTKRDQLVAAYSEMYRINAFKGSEYDIVEEVEKVIEETKKLAVEDKNPASGEPKVDEKPRFTKSILKKGDKMNFPKRGDWVSCYYIGKLEDGTVFDSLQPGTKKKRNQPIKFRVGKGNVIKGWDEAVLTMSVGEKCEVKIEPEWGYGKAGKPEAKIPKNATLIFEIELFRVD